MTCGVYKITHIASGMAYVGMSTKIEDRWATHQKALSLKGMHPKGMENRFGTKVQYGGGGDRLYQFARLNDLPLDSFRFEILEVCPGDTSKDALLKREDYWLRRLEPELNADTYQGGRKVTASQSPPREWWL